MIFALIAITLSSLQPEAGLRVVNPNATAAQATLCGRTFQVAPGAVEDLHPAALCESPTLESETPLVVLELSEDSQRALVEAGCPAPAMRIPAFACPSGTTAASVPAIEGATYTWTAEGAAILEGAGTPRVLLALGTDDKATIRVAINSLFCTTTATGVIAVRPPLAIRDLKSSPEPQRGKPLVLTWSYGAGASPRSQTLISDLFEAPVELPGDARSYTFTPDAGGTRSFELRGTYAVTAKPPSSGGRRRAVASTGEPAVVCPSASSTIQVDIRGCANTRPRISHAEVVEAGSLFGAEIFVADGEKVEWSVENGTLVSSSVTGSRATLRAGASGDVQITVVKDAGDFCVVTSTAKVPIFVSAADCPNTPPTATVALDGWDCDEGANITATFKGKPPFFGRWTDGTEFRVDTQTLTRRVRETGTWSLSSFHDARCRGPIIGAATVGPMQPTVKLTGTQLSCGGGKVFATFTGHPPFSAVWSDGVAFTTSETTYERSVGKGEWSIGRLKDARCTRNWSYGSDTLGFAILGPPTASIFGPVICVERPELGAYVHATIGRPGVPPFRVEWADGVVTESEAANGVLSRQVPTPTDDFEETYAITRATAGECETDVRQGSAKVVYAPVPQVEVDDVSVCVGDSITARVTNALAPSAKFEWKASGATFTTSRFEREATITSHVQLTTNVTLDVTQHGACTAKRVTRLVSFVEKPPPLQLSASASTIAPFGKVTLKWKGWSMYRVTASPESRIVDLRFDGCQNGTCTGTFFDTVGSRASITITMSVTGCDRTQVQSVTINVAP